MYLLKDIIYEKIVEKVLYPDTLSRYTNVGCHQVRVTKL